MLLFLLLNTKKLHRYTLQFYFLFLKWTICLVWNTEQKFSVIPFWGSCWSVIWNLTSSNSTQALFVCSFVSLCLSYMPTYGSISVQYIKKSQMYLGHVNGSYIFPSLFVFNCMFRFVQNPIIFHFCSKALFFMCWDKCFHVQVWIFVFLDGFFIDFFTWDCFVLRTFFL